MGVRKNAKFLSATEKENFVKACVLMKAQIVNPAAAAANQYSRWDEYVALHRMIQNAFAPGSSVVNFGHGGSGAFSFLSWHRYFLYEFEKQLQSHVPGVMLPYWDWSDPALITTDTFLGPNGTTGSEVRSGYFARNAPGTPGNVTPAPAWWPAGLTGWILPNAFGSTWLGALRRNFRTVPELPTATDLRETLSKTTYSAFQNALESGVGLTSSPTQQMHNGMHGWIGGHMGNPFASPFDPFFYLHHCNIDRLWAMWQADGHADVYPTAGGSAQHHRNDIMYPWTGGAAGYGTNAPIGSGAANIPMPDFTALGAKRNVDTLDYRSAFGYTYDTLSVMGIGLDRTGSMNGLTPDPMTTGAPDVTKWEAAKRGVSMFLQDAETVQNSGTAYLVAGIKTFRRVGAANDFAPVFPAPNYGLIKGGGSFSRAAFDTAAAAMTPGGSTPLADALLDVQNTLVTPPFAGLPANEQRYLAMLTDGIRTAGALFSTIPDGSLGRTGVFAMGFGTGAEVDYATLQTMVNKGRTLTTVDAAGNPVPVQQIFHGENAGTIDKFYTNALARAIGFTAVFDPVIELFAGEHTHLSFHATSADDTFLVTAQGMDFIDDHWTFHLHAPDGTPVHADEADSMQHGAHAGCQHCCRKPHATVSRANGRLTIVLQRDNADDACWVGEWTLMAAYKARRLDGMLMPTLGQMLFPLSAAPARGPRYSRLLQSPKERLAQRNISQRARHGLDEIPVSTNRNGLEACDLVMNVYARSSLDVALTHKEQTIRVGDSFAIALAPSALNGSVSDLRAFGRLAAPAQDWAAVLARVTPKNLPKEGERLREGKAAFDPALALAAQERRDPKLARIRDEELHVVAHHDGPLHMHVEKAETPGVYHIAAYVEGWYCPGHAGGHQHDDTGHGTHRGADLAAACPPQRFSRLLTTQVIVAPARSRRRHR